MFRYKYLQLLFLLPFFTFSQSTTHNYVKSTTYEVPATTAQILSVPQADKKEEITYYDGLGRPKQKIQNKESGTGKDFVTPMQYDALGNQVKEFLPYVVNNTNMNYVSTATTDVSSYPYYSGQNPYTERLIESSPLKRILKQASPGVDWVMGSGHEMKYDYLANITADQVKLFTATATWNAAELAYDNLLNNSSGNVFYAVGQLFKTVTKDENWKASDINNHSVQEFKNKKGQLVLKRTFDNNIALDTYYVYDQFDNLAFVIPPKADGNITLPVLSNICYQFLYDDHNRLVKKILPEKTMELIVYDKLNRPIAVGPTLSPFGTGVVGWLVTKYDVYNRVVYTGWYSDVVTALTRATKQSYQNGLSSTISLNEAKSSGVSIDGIATGYSNSLEPTNIEVLTVNYYDNYDFPIPPTIPTTILGGAQSIFYNNTSQKPIGLYTGKWDRVLQTASDNNGQITYVLYDNKKRPVRTYRSNYPSGYTQTDDKIEFFGKKSYTITEHKFSSSSTPITVREDFTYTDQDRMALQTHSINGAQAQLLSKNEYDDLGQLVVKRIGGIDLSGSACLQKMDLQYNIRGWLKQVNSIDDLSKEMDNTTSQTPTDLFAYKLNYTSSSQPIYNGSISESYWKSKSDFFLRKYIYQYDSMNRLSNAIYQKETTSANSFGESMTYDKGGNLLTLDRNGGLDDPLTAMQIDDLTYSYNLNSNRLLKVIDATNSPSGFLDDSDGITDVSNDYDYDLFGNLTKDENKSITSITYNHLNLPVKIQFTTDPNTYIDYVYTAEGKKIQKNVHQYNPPPGVNVPITVVNDYRDGFQYKNNVLLFLNTIEGYVNNTVSGGNNVYNYVYNYKDQLGNIRLSYGLNSSGVLKIIEENHYYPFGLKHNGYNTEQMSFMAEGGLMSMAQAAAIGTPAPPAYKYKYNGKEWQDELALNLFDYGARNYDPAIARWMNMDAKAELYTSISPYVYSLNTPINAIDPDGKLVIFVNGFFSRIGNVVGLAPGKPLENYWNFFDDEFIGSARDFLGVKSEESNYFVDGSSNFGGDQSGTDRYDNGYEYAKANYMSIISQMAKGETLKFVGHSEGSAFAAGMMAYFLDRAMVDASTPKVESSLHLSPDEADEFDLPDYGGTDFQVHNLNDPVSPFNILTGAEFVVTGTKSSKLGAHGGTVSKSMMNRLQAILEAFINSDHTKKIETDSLILYYHDPAEQPSPRN